MQESQGQIAFPGKLKLVAKQTILPDILTVTFNYVLIQQGQEFTEKFLLEYQREDDGEWIRFRNRQAAEVGAQKTWIYIYCYCGLPK